MRAQRPVTPYERTVHGNPQAGGDGLAAMVGMLLEAWTRPPAIARLRYAEPEARAGDDEPSRTEQGEDAGRLLPVRAGDGFYARTLYAVDSDYPGPVVLELLQPPLAGAVAHGGFERAGTRLVLRLTSLTWDGATFPIEAWGVDPDCACYGIEGEVDRHFLARVVLPAAARFAEGFSMPWPCPPGPSPSTTERCFTSAPRPAPRRRSMRAPRRRRAPSATSSWRTHRRRPPCGSRATRPWW